MPTMPPGIRRDPPNLWSMLLTVVIVLVALGGLVALGAFKHPAEAKRDAAGWIVPKEETDAATSSCQAAGYAAYNMCRNELNDQWYDAGAVDEPKMQKARDYSRCERVEEAAFHACNQYGKEDQ